MIMCADHHVDVGLCGCEPDAQYRRAQAFRPATAKKTMCAELTADEMATLQDLSEAAQPTWAMLNDLRREEGATVTLCCNNPDFEGPENIIDVCGSWTDWNDRRFDGDSIHEAVRAAWRAMRAEASK